MIPVTCRSRKKSGASREKLKVDGSEPSAEVAAIARADLGALLTTQEQACLRLVAQRLSSKEIAARLGIAKTSVDTYCNRARHKLGVSDRYAAARLLVAQSPNGPPQAPPRTLDGLRPRRNGGALMATAAGLLAGALGLGSLLAGMAALEALKPPGERAADAQPRPKAGP
jgi:DNA-binding CsgD family transcriptional regulator